MKKITIYKLLLLLVTSNIAPYGAQQTYNFVPIKRDAEPEITTPSFNFNQSTITNQHQKMSGKIQYQHSSQNTNESVIVVRESTVVPFSQQKGTKSNSRFTDNTDNTIENNNQKNSIYVKILGQEYKLPQDLYATQQKSSVCIGHKEHKCFIININNMPLSIPINNVLVIDGKKITIMTEQKAGIDSNQTQSFSGKDPEHSLKSILDNFSPIPSPKNENIRDSNKTPFNDKKQKVREGIFDPMRSPDNKLMSSQQSFKNLEKQNYEENEFNKTTETQKQTYPSSQQNQNFNQQIFKSSQKQTGNQQNYEDNEKITKMQEQIDFLSQKLQQQIFKNSQKQTGNQQNYEDNEKITKMQEQIDFLSQNFNQQIFKSLQKQTGNQQNYEDNEFNKTTETQKQSYPSSQSKNFKNNFDNQNTTPKHYDYGDYKIGYTHSGGQSQNNRDEYSKMPTIYSSQQNQNFGQQITKAQDQIKFLKLQQESILQQKTEDLSNSRINNFSEKYPRSDYDNQNLTQYGNHQKIENFTNNRVNNFSEKNQNKGGYGNQQRHQSPSPLTKELNSLGSIFCGTNRNNSRDYNLDTSSPKNYQTPLKLDQYNSHLQKGLNYNPSNFESKYSNHSIYTPPITSFTEDKKLNLSQNNTYQHNSNEYNNYSSQYYNDQKKK